MLSGLTITVTKEGSGLIDQAVKAPTDMYVPVVFDHIQDERRRLSLITR